MLEINMMENGKMIKLMDLANYIQLMAINMKVNGKIIKKMV